MHTQTNKGSYSLESASVRNPSRSFINKLLPYKTVSAAFDRAIKATLNCTETLENLAAKVESR